MSEGPVRVSWIGKRVRFAPNPGKPQTVVEATVEAHRPDPRKNQVTGPRSGWLDTRDDAGAFRSVKPGRCEVVG